jgi:hypothetical protein
MLEKSDIAHLIRKHSLMQGEVDSRHIGLLNEIYALGIVAGKAQAKAAVEWRINGPMWAGFIEEGTVWP